MLLNTENLAELIGRKHRCLIQLRELGRRQAALISSGDLGELLRMFAGKQRLIDQLQEIERNLDPFRAQPSQSRIWASAGVRNQCGDLVEQSQRLLDEILEQEEHNESALRLKREAAAAKLQSLQVTKHAKTAYAESTAPNLRGFDLST